MADKRSQAKRRRAPSAATPSPPDKRPELPVKRLFRQQTLLLLRGTIQRLQQVVDRLETDDQTSGSATSPSSYFFTAMGAWLLRVQSASLRWMRRTLPTPWHRRLSDSVLTGLLIATIVGLIGISTLFFGQPSSEPISREQPSLDQSSSGQIRADAPPVASSETSSSGESAPVSLLPETGPSSEASLPTTLEPKPTVEFQPDTAPLPGLPGPTTPLPDQAADSFSSTSSELPPEELPTGSSQANPASGSAPSEPNRSQDQPDSQDEVTIVITPQPSLVDSIQEQLSQAITDFNTTLIQRIQPHYRNGQLEITLTKNWYQLDPDQQDQLAATLWQQAKRLNFVSVELQDDQPLTIARSPVIGERMIILRR